MVVSDRCDSVVVRVSVVLPWFIGIVDQVECVPDFVIVHDLSIRG